MKWNFIVVLFLFFSLKFYVYDENDISTFREILQNLKKTFVGSRSSPCKQVNGAPVRNPVYEKYASIRNEPRHVEPHRLAFAVQNGRLPKKGTKLVISHLCHGHTYSRKKKRKCCINFQHLIKEATCLNCSRNNCYRLLKKKAREWRRLRNKRLKKRKLFLKQSQCKHRPTCFLSVGRWIS